MKKILVLTLLPLALCGCKNKKDNNNKQNWTPSVTPETPFNDYLSFVNQNKFYLDVNVDAKLPDLAITLSGNPLSGGQQYSFSSGSEFQVGGSPTENVVNIYAVYLKGETFSNQIYTGVGASSFVNNALFALNAVKNADKAYVCITTETDGWNHNLNSDLNDYITVSQGSVN